MSHQDILSILITFTVGLFAGGYLYVAGFATTFKLPDVDTKDSYSKLVIVGKNYGSCEENFSCLSFQVLENGTYRALFDNPAGGEPIVKEGNLSGALRNELDKVLTPTTLGEESMMMENPKCHFDYSTGNYRFKITRDNSDYSLDTCINDINYSGKTWTSMVKLWNFFIDLSS
jgi:hypothetical protein